MVCVKPIIIIEKAKKVALTKKRRCAIYAVADETIFPSRIRQFYYVDVVSTDCGFYFNGCIRVVDNN